jgi:hypothetical protein
MLTMPLVLSQMKACTNQTTYELLSHETNTYICGPYGDTAGS